MTVLSGVGIEPIVLPTALYSMHTGFEGYSVCDTAIYMNDTLDSWQSLGLQLDCIYSGFLKGMRQIDTLVRAIREYKCLNIIDPACADNGQLYDGYDMQFVHYFADTLLPLADILLPNITEAMLLTGTPYQAPPYNRQFVVDLALKLLDRGARQLAITGVHLQDDTFGVLVVNGSSLNLVVQEYMQGHFSGAGDLWASIFVCAILYCDMLAASEIACTNTLQAIINTQDANWGINCYSIMDNLRLEIDRANKYSTI
jgi:pyridoxine kinase